MSVPAVMWSSEKRIHEGSPPTAMMSWSTARRVTPSVVLTFGMTSRPVRNCSQNTMQKPRPPMAQSVAMRMPSTFRTNIAATSSEADAMPSRPWSRNSPSGLVWPVRRACGPSMLSKVRYARKKMAETR